MLFEAIEQGLFVVLDVAGPEKQRDARSEFDKVVGDGNDKPFALRDCERLCE